MIKEQIFSSPESVYGKIKELLTPNIQGLLCLGGGRLDGEKRVFDFSSIKNIVSIDWSDEGLDATKDQVACIKYDVSKFYILFRPRSFDVVSFMDVIEHNYKKDAYDILKKAEEVARKQIILFVPIQSALGFTDDEGNRIRENSFKNNLSIDHHYSLWLPKDFEELGYDVYSDPDYHFRRTNGEMPWGAMICSKVILP